MGESTWKIRTVRIGTPAEAPARLRALRRPAEESEQIAARVARTLAAVRRRGDAALVQTARAYDWPCPGPQALQVPAEALASAWRAMPARVRAALKEAAASIEAFHARQSPGRCAPLRREGLRAGLEVLPLESVGLYVPGGRAAYPSTLLMLAIPAKLAGVRRIAVASPAGPGGLPSRGVLAAARLLGIEEVYALGGAAAVGAFAYGTATVPRVDKIAGPGNAYVAEAKRQVFGDVGIDAVAGPTELVVLSDGSAPAAFVAADLLAQAEHDVAASAVLLTTDPAEPARVRAELRRRLETSPRAAIQRESLRRFGALALCAGRETACAAARHLAPEHLSVMTADPGAWAALVPTAAAVFLGPFSPEAAGDYGAGPNHSLPTSGTARFASPVTVWDFVRAQSYLELSAAALSERISWMAELARLEGLEGHAASLEIRRRTP
jgi:histidinol dehydrogenase